MESEHEIREMRVQDLRNFLRRHDTPVNQVGRADGTPGPPRKSELLTAALQVVRQAARSVPSPDQPPNPFQMKRASPEASQQQLLTTPPRRPPSRQRRRSSTWLDPALLLQLRAPTPSNPPASIPPSELSTAPSNQDPIQPTPPSGPRTLPISSTVATSKPVQMRPLYPARHVQSSSHRILPSRPTSTSVVKASPTSRPLTRRIEPISQPRQPPSPLRTVLDPDETYCSEDDPDYDGDAEDDPDDYNSPDDERQIPPPAQVIDLTHPPPLPASDQIITVVDDKDDPDEIQPVTFRSQRTQPSTAYQEDLPFDSDAHMSDRASTVDTEDEHHTVDFSSWSPDHIRDWLLAHDIRSNRNASKVELVGLARAHALRIEALSDDQNDHAAQTPPVSVQQPHAPHERSSRNPRSRRAIFAPTLHETNPSLSRKSYRSNHTSSTRNSSTLSKRKTSSAFKGLSIFSARVFTRGSVCLLAIFLLMLWSTALKYLTEPMRLIFCDTNAITNHTASGELCRKCPRYALCQNGNLNCDSGYVEQGVKCIPDLVFNKLVEELAKFAFETLSKLAGRSLCGEAIPYVLSSTELEAVLRGYFFEQRDNNPSFLRHGVDETQMLLDATKQVLRGFKNIEYNVYVSPSGHFGSNEPILSFSCELKRQIMLHKYEVFIALFLFIALVYLRTKLYLWRRRERRIDAAHQKSLEYLREQVNGFRNGEEDVAFISDVILREEVLGRVTPKIIEIWKEVEKRLNRDPRAIRKHQTVKGMPSYTYEYVGSRRASGSIFDSLSRRSSSFGSRTSLDSLDLRSDSEVGDTPRRSFGESFLGMFDRQ